MLIILLYRQIRYGYPFRRIPLTKGKYAIVDPQDYARLSKYKWHARPSHRTFYAGRTVTSRKGGKQKTILMHREIIRVPEWMYVDHINHNGLDNRRANLRPATKTENAWHSRKISRKTGSRYKGVSRIKRQKKWQAAIMANTERKFLGHFDSEIQAARAYDEAARKYHRNFAETNF